MQGQGELDDPQVGAQVASRGGHRIDDEAPDLLGQDVELLGSEGSEVGGAVDVFQDHKALGLSRYRTDNSKLWSCSAVLALRNGRETPT